MSDGETHGERIEARRPVPFELLRQELREERGELGVTLQELPTNLLADELLRRLSLLAVLVSAGETVRARARDAGRALEEMRDAIKAELEKQGVAR